MFNDRLSTEAAKERITQRMKEVEGYASQKQLGLGDSGGTKWMVVLVLLLIVVAISLLI